MGDLIIPLTRGQSTVIDEEDAALVVPFTWHAQEDQTSGKFFAATGSRSKRRLMHRLILSAASGTEIDHRDRDSLNNRRSNLRLATRSQNAANQEARKNTASKFKGVSPYRTLWRAQIRVKGQRFYLGYFKTEEEAAIAYDKAASMHFGEFAFLNFPHLHAPSSCDQTITGAVTCVSTSICNPSNQ